MTVSDGATGATGILLVLTGADWILKVLLQVLLVQTVLMALQGAHRSYWY